MPPPAWPSWCGRWMARLSSRHSSPTERLNAVVLGPGGGVGPAMREQVLAALAGEAAVVLDADALTSFAERAGGAVRGDPRRTGQGAVLTPHEGEFARLFRSDI